MLCGALAGLAVVGQAALLSRALDAAFLGGAGLAALAPLLGALAATAAVRALLAWLQELLAQRYSAAARLAVRDRLVRRLLALGPRYATGERTGELANTLLGGVEALDAYLAQYLPQSALALVVPALVLAAVLWRDPPSAFVLLVTFPLVPLFMWLIGSAAEARTRRQWETLSRLAARFHDALAGLATLRAFGRADDECRLLEADSERHRALTMDVLRLAMASALALEALATLGTAVVAVEVGLRLLYARLAFRDAFFVLGAGARVLQAAADAGSRVSRGAGRPGSRGAHGRDPRPRGSARRARARGARGRRSASGAPSFVERPPRIRFESVAFSYAPGRRALDGLTLEIEAGTTLALVGATGAGKTTVAHLLLRFLEPDLGRVLVDDTPLATCAPEDWRRRVAWVPQQPRLFHGTLPREPAAGAARRDGRGSSSAASSSRASTSWCGSCRGASRRPSRRAASGSPAARRSAWPWRGRSCGTLPLVVLDEPTAQLDLSTESRVVDGVGELRRGRTVLLIAHRLTTVAAADRVAVVSQGRLIEQGAPAALAASGRVYPRLLAAWRGTA